MNGEKLKEKWSVAQVSKIQILGFLPFTLEEWECMTKGEVETKLIVGLGLDYWSNSKMLLNCYWVKPNEGEVEPRGEASDALLTVAVDDELVAVPWTFPRLYSLVGIHVRENMSLLCDWSYRSVYNLCFDLLNRCFTDS